VGVDSGDRSLTSEERKELREALLDDKGPAYLPRLVKEFGAQAGLFISQLLFWDGKGRDPDGWIYKTEERDGAGDGSYSLGSEESSQHPDQEGCARGGQAPLGVTSRSQRGLKSRKGSQPSSYRQRSLL
jgi:hypothetical protein